PSVETILVTGGAGFIGGTFVRQWIAHEQDAVVNFDKLTYAGNLDSLTPVMDDSRHRIVRGDIADRAAVDELLAANRPRAIVQFAAESGVDRCIDGPEDFDHTDVVVSFRLLDAARRYWAELGPAARAKFRFLHVCTDEVYGSLGPEGRFQETSAY